MSWVDDRRLSFLRICIIRKSAAYHRGNEILLREDFLSWEDFKMILASSEVPSTVSLSSWSIMGSELIKSGITNGCSPREVVGSNSCPAGSCSSLVRATNTGSPKESIRDFSSHYMLGYWWRSFKVGFRVGLSLADQRWMHGRDKKHKVLRIPFSFWPAFRRWATSCRQALLGVLFKKKL